MWTKIKDVKKVEIGDKILRHPSNGENAVQQPTGQEENSDFYEVTSKTFDGVSMKWLATGTIENISLGNMTRQVSFSDLVNGQWWTEKNG
jgi:hypothetical protein